MSALVLLGLVLAGGPVLVAGYAYLGYPLLLKILTLRADRGYPTEDPPAWPSLTVSLPAYNEAAVIGDTLENLLAADYPRDRLQVLVVSDASTDGTDEIVRGFADRGVELLRMERRGGKTAGENAAMPRLRGEIVVNTDATSRLGRGALGALARVFADPQIGCASGRDVSVGAEDANVGESGYVGYEMWIRSLETRAGSIVGSSGCLYAIRRELHARRLPAELSRDFASALVTHEAGLRAVSVEEAVVGVPRTPSLRREFRRKVRTMARGLDTLWYKRHLLNPVRHGRFAVALFSHKLCRWLVPPTLPLAPVGLILLLAQAGRGGAAAGVAGATLAVGAVGAAALRWPDGRPMPRAFELCGYLAGGVAAGVLAWMKALRGDREATWEPTRRDEPSGAA